MGVANYANKAIVGPLIRFIFKISTLGNRYKVLNTNSVAIGHLCVDVDCFLKEHTYREFSFKGILLANKLTIANNAIARLWGGDSRIVVIESPWLCYMLDYLRVYPETSFDCSGYCATDGRPALVYDVYEKYNHKYPIITWNSRLLDQGMLLFKKRFPTVDIKKVVVLHSRDNLYDRSTSNPNLLTQTYRNSDLRSFDLILEYLVSIGYSVIRIGNYERINTGLSNLYYELDLPNKKENDLLQVILTSKCAVFLGSASGASNLAAIWNRPIFLLNVLPYALMRPHQENCMAVPKILKDNGRILTANKIFTNKFHWYRSDEEYRSSNLEIVQNESIDCIEDFKEFFQAFVIGDRQMKTDLKNSNELSRYKEMCPSDSYDYNAKSLIPRNFFKKNNIV